MCSKCSASERASVSVGLSATSLTRPSYEEFKRLQDNRTQ